MVMTRSRIRGARRGLMLMSIVLSVAAPTMAFAGPDPCAAGIGPTITVQNSGASDYIINGLNDPEITVVRGCTYTFDVNAPGHPFLLKSVQGSGSGNTYNDGVANNGAQVGQITWTVSAAAPATLFYNCQFHGAMTGVIRVIDGNAPNAEIFANGFES